MNPGVGTSAFVAGFQTAETTNDENEEEEVDETVLMDDKLKDVFTPDDKIAMKSMLESNFGGKLGPESIKALLDKIDTSCVNRMLFNKEEKDETNCSKEDLG